ncbi:MAG: patatin-like phospholipase family protein [Deltaproteobacteria bacterium]|nr:patatin-like phospholipase family protein [Deltaproteobacteria bacterium]MBW2418014.1 patatin-like phospholipase family protein [Deltaproteobacteria bacterium]
MEGRFGSPFDAVVFAGGGCRCFWQAGFWSVARPVLGIEPRVVAGVSAGAAFACSALAGTGERVLADFKHRSAANARNVYPRNVLGSEPVFPHERMYRGTIADNIDEAGFERLRGGPELRFLIARPPSWLGARSGMVVGIVAGLLNARERRVHARWGNHFGFKPEVVSVQSCRNAQELADLILHSSCTPPVVPLYRRGRRIVLDGGLLDNAPASLVGRAQSTLVLLTRHYGERKTPRVPGRTYVQPSRRVPIAKWDYTSPDLIQQTYDLGRRDGEAFARSFEGWHEDPRAGLEENRQMSFARPSLAEALVR